MSPKQVSYTIQNTEGFVSCILFSSLLSSLLSFLPWITILHSFSNFFLLSFLALLPFVTCILFVSILSVLASTLFFPSFFSYLCPLWFLPSFLHLLASSLYPFMHPYFLHFSLPKILISLYPIFSLSLWFFEYLQPAHCGNIYQIFMVNLLLLLYILKINVKDRDPLESWVWKSL